MKELFLVCALAAPAANFTHPAIDSYQTMKSEEDRLKDWIRKNNPDADVFITPQGQEGKLREYGWERFPATYKGKQIWIQRKPKSDQPKKLIETQA